MNTVLTTKKDLIDDEINRVLTCMGTMKPESEEYGAAVKNLQTLYDARSKKANNRVSADTLVIAITNIVGILMILNHEEMNVISSKALGFILRGRT